MRNKNIFSVMSAAIKIYLEKNEADLFRKIMKFQPKSPSRGIRC